MVDTLLTRRHVSPHSTGSTSPSSKRKMDKRSDQNGMQQRDIEFPTHDVTVVERIDAFGSSLFYEAEENARNHVSGTSRRKFRIKATLATTQEQARRAAAEVQVLRRIPEHLNILKLIDSGWSVVDQGIGEHEEHDEELLEERRLYCLLFKECPSRSVRDIMEKHRIKFMKNFDGMSNGASQGAQNSGWMKIETVMGIFRQMAGAVSVLHTTNESRTIHLDLRPDHFCAYKTSSETKMGCNYIVKLIGAGCAVDGSMSLESTPDRKRAAYLINSTTTLRYRAPEMVDLHLADKLTDKVDIWALGCCLYGLLFLTDCFQDENKLAILTGKYQVPHEHPYSNDVLDLLSRTIEPDAEKRLDIHEVISCIDAIRSGEPLPTRRCNTLYAPNRGGLPLLPVSLSELHDSHSHISVRLPQRPQALSVDAPLYQAWRDNSFDRNSNVTAIQTQTQWLEFVPNGSNGSCVTRLAHPITPLATGTSYKSEIIENNLTGSQALEGSQRSTKNDKIEAQLSAWTLGLLHFPSRSSLFILSDSSDEDDDNSSQQCLQAPPLKAPSRRDIDESGIDPVQNESIDRLTILEESFKTLRGCTEQEGDDSAQKNWCDQAPPLKAPSKREIGVSGIDPRPNERRNQEIVRERCFMTLESHTKSNSPTRSPFSSDPIVSLCQRISSPDANIKCSPSLKQKGWSQRLVYQYSDEQCSNCVPLVSPAGEILRNKLCMIQCTLEETPPIRQSKNLSEGTLDTVSTIDTSPTVSSAKRIVQNNGGTADIMEHSQELTYN